MIFWEIEAINRADVTWFGEGMAGFVLLEVLLPCGSAFMQGLYLDLWFTVAILYPLTT